jgi:phosphoribosyl 1,2-cyclic phosphate phosphodiesterase
MSLTLTILGCGSSGGVPRVAQGWGGCDPANVRNRRRRCSLLVEQEKAGARTTVLIDTSPDLREQLLAEDVKRLDAVLFTHDHADHTHGIDDLRPLALAARGRIDVHMDEATARTMHQRFGYCFRTPPGSEYPPIATEHRVLPGQRVVVAGAGGEISALPFDQAHGDTRALGYRIGRAAYSPDVNDIPQASFAALADLEVWIVDALRYRRHPSHFSLEETLSWIERMKPRRAVLTNLHSDLDYETLRRNLPDRVEPAYDGMRITL